MDYAIIFRRGAWPVLCALFAHQRKPGAGIPAQLLSGTLRREPTCLRFTKHIRGGQIEPAGRADFASIGDHRCPCSLECSPSRFGWRSCFTPMYLANWCLYLAFTGSVCMVYALAVTAGRHFFGNGC